MEKNNWLISAVAFVFLIFSLSISAQTSGNPVAHTEKQNSALKNTNKKSESTATDNITQQRIQMHEYMMQMQQQAIDCLKSGKSEDQCRQQYRRHMQNMHDQYWQDNDDHYWDDNWDNHNRQWHHGCCNMMNMMH